MTVMRGAQRIVIRGTFVAPRREHQATRSENHCPLNR
jgi:hypothetical protein